MMVENVKRLLRHSGLYQIGEPIWLRLELARWARCGRKGAAPRLIKRHIVRDLGAKLGIHTLIETGTYEGDMVRAQLSKFRRIVTIEIDAKLASRAARRFASNKHVTVLHGSSADLLAQVLATTNERCLFWLDAHYSGGITGRAAVDTPIYSELKTILAHPQRHVILIDDAREFVGLNDYPTIAEIETLVNSMRPEMTVQVADDVIRIVASE